MSRCICNDKANDRGGDGPEQLPRYAELSRKNNKGQLLCTLWKGKNSESVTRLHQTRLLVINSHYVKTSVV